MLSQVAGPIPLHSIELGETTIGVSGTGGQWLDGVGFLFHADSNPGHVAGGWYIAQLDGACVLLLDTYAAVQTIGYAPELDHPAVSTAFRNYEVGFPACGRLSPEWNNSLLRPFLLFPDRRLIASGSQVQRQTLTEPPTNTSSSTEYTFSALDFSANALLHAGRAPNGNRAAWVVDQAGGRMALYDCVANTEVPGRRSGIGGTNKLVGYSVRHQLWMAIRGDGPGGADQLYVFASEPACSQLSAATMDPASRRGGRSVLKVRALGSYGEPCPDRNVTFAVDQGAVEPATVATDADGYASTFYCATTGRGAIAAVGYTATLEE